ncbi:hypothetical protein ACMAUO_14340 [Gluconacetobacter sp. Hr-1-5]|uniref:hypothetical protein n=1 Tax=Gluconacetobacter sp. Hr-1-5 TaxID=3395370 RepID=UPI003B51A63F
MTFPTQDDQKERSVEFLLYNEKRLKTNFAELQKQYLLALQKLRATEQAHAALQEQVNAINGKIGEFRKGYLDLQKERDDLARAITLLKATRSS